MKNAYFIYLAITALLLIVPNDAARLESYKINPQKITTSGISAGASMANQLHVAFSATISGSGTIAGAPYYCAMGSMLTATTTCMSGFIGTVNLPSIQSKVASYKSQNLIDDPANLRNHNVYIFSGVSDFVVRNTVVKKGGEFFSNYMDSSRIKGVYNYAATHGMITDFYGTACAVTSPYFMNNCNYNQAHDIFRTLYTNETILMPTQGAVSTGKLLEFDQTEFFPSGTVSLISMDQVGYIYVPTVCETEECKLHIALHGCGMGKNKIGDIYAKNSGYNQNADLNKIIVVYPQIKSNFVSNANGCWDWWGYTDANYANKNGKQMMTIKAIIDRIAFRK